MKARLTTTVFFAASLCCLLAGCAKPCPKNRLDITLAGPWLLYQDFQFDAWGKKVPVLIAIAPKGAGAATTDMGDKDKEDHHDSQYHHLPQISAGDGYYIQDAGVYCLYFDDKCAPKGPNSLRSAGYFQVATLPAAFHGENGKTIWDLIDPTKVVAVILPMPDSYSNAGVWKARFGTSLDTIRSGHSSEREISIGLQLHYANGPTEFYLRRCDVPATAENCRHKLNNINHTNLKNTGTLEVLMRAPDNISACDPHVRYAYKMVLDLLGRDINPDIGTIDPALSMNADGTANYDQAPYNCREAPAANGGVNALVTSDQKATAAMPTTLGVPTLLNLLGDILRKANGHPDIVVPVTTAKALADDLDPQFPRISQVQEIGALVRKARKKALEDPNLSEADRADLIQKMDEADETGGTKNGSDCRAPILIITPNTGT